ELQVSFNFFVNPAGTAVPNVTLATPANYSLVPTSSTVPVQATASTTVGAISKVEFYASGPFGTSKFGERTSPDPNPAPPNSYSVNWSVAQPGIYTITARAFADSPSRIGVSSPVTIAVVDHSQNFRPVAVDDTISVVPGDPPILVNVLANDYDPNGD